MSYRVTRVKDNTYNVSLLILLLKYSHHSLRYKFKIVILKNYINKHNTQGINSTSRNWRRGLCIEFCTFLCDESPNQRNILDFSYAERFNFNIKIAFILCV